MIPIVFFAPSDFLTVALFGAAADDVPRISISVDRGAEVLITIRSAAGPVSRRTGLRSVRGCSALHLVNLDGGGLHESPYLFQARSAGWQPTDFLVNSNEVLDWRLVDVVSVELEHAVAHQVPGAPPVVPIPLATMIFRAWFLESSSAGS